jgi:peptidylprolyl isomerase
VIEKNPKKMGLMAAVVGLLLITGLAACQSATPLPAGESSTTSGPTETVPAPNAPIDVPASPTPVVLAGATTTASGLQYLEVVAGSGAAPQIGDVISMQYIANLPDGTELGNTYKANKPVTTVWGRKSLLPGWEEGIGLMKVGGKAKMVVPPELAFGADGSGQVPANTPIIIEVELLSVKPAPSPTTVTADLLIKTASGLQYYDISLGEGPQAAKLATVVTGYALWIKTVSGYDFLDSSEGGSPVSFVLGKGDTVFPGWEEGVAGMKVGGKRLLVIPPELGLGAEGGGNVPANSTLVMEIELVSSKEPQAAVKVNEQDYTTTQSGLKYYDLKVGSGSSPTIGQTVVVHYTGWLQDGTQFDSSVDRGQPFSFQIGKGAVIPGWDEGVLTMKIGGKRQLLIPPSLAYGASGSGNTIPPNSTLIFEVELLEIKP